ncbi:MULTISPECIES: formylglycine-generating enzyme family protein [Rhodobacterales]|uniref:formylglycine-generating enzyme family protein n=1 Tax=Rhodobacterales TaxID=204455 RepID=UPI0015F0FD37|nr:MULTISPECIES: formylglycine-generating enzyme family protein [Rhodobacterales]MDO6588682.1 formylglycine-generating enzyme family protein [Yoonia sp. 1_MG-2023]
MNATIKTILFALGCVFAATTSIAETAPTYQLTDGQTVGELEMFQECADCPEMIVMPLGSFMMGAILGESRNPFDIYGPDATGTVRGPDEINIIPSEHPRHQVVMDIPYAMARNELTYAEWMICVDAGGCSHSPDINVLTRQGYVVIGPDHPVINVSYLDILEYVAWLNAQVGDDVYRLPTEAEWEYAARAGTTTRFAQGDDLTSDQANFSGRATEHLRRGQSMPYLANQNAPIPVGELDAANTWGLRHMSGNVREYTLSCWSDEHLGLSSDSAYLADALGQTDCERRVAKGGAHNGAMDSLRLARRVRPENTTRRDFFGFRLIRTFDTG